VMDARRGALFLCACAVLLFYAATCGGTPNWRPVVLMHGLLTDKSTMDDTIQWISGDYPGMYILNVEIGDGFLDSLFMDINVQVEHFAATVAADPQLSKGFNLICHSQGGLICRAFIERYNYPPVYNFASWAGPHGGVYGVPDLNALCPDVDCPWLNWIMDEILAGSWVNTWVQEHASFAAYWKDPFLYSEYLQANIFLADINNERTPKNSTYKERLTSLNTLMLLHSTTDEVVIPNTSPWFESYKVGQDVVVVPLNQSDQFKDDWVGLQTLSHSGRLQLRAVPCGHHEILRSGCKKYYELYTRPLLNNTL